STNYYDAADAYKAVAEKYSGQRSAYAYAGYAACIYQLRAKKDAEMQATADEAIAKAMAITPVSPEVHVKIGDALLVRGRYKECIAEYDAAVHLNPRHIPAYNHATVLVQYIPSDKLLPDLMKEIGYSPMPFGDDLVEGDRAWIAGKLPDAIAHYENGLKVE